MRKKLLSMLLICLCILGLAACGQDQRSIDYNGMSYDELEQAATMTWQNLLAMDITQVEAAIEQIDSMSEAEQIAVMEANVGMKEQLALMRSWVSVKEQAGEFIGVDSFNVTKTGKSTNTELILKFENRPVIFSIVYSNRDMSVENTTVDLVYTTGEKMQKAALNTLMGMGTVFIMLIVICLIISCFSVIPKLEKKLKDKKNQEEGVQAPAQAAFQPVEEAPQAASQDDFELAAVIAAAIAAATGQSTDDFVVRSIKRR